MLKERVVFCAVGQGGGNIVRELELKGCQCYYVNSSLDDLDTIDTDYNNKYHISKTKGMAKDIEMAKEVIESDENDDKIVEAVYKQYANASIYFFVYTAAGGTGGGMGNSIAKRMKQRFPDKTVNSISVKPHREEDMVMQYNANICLEGIDKLLEEDYITNVQILDNNKRDYNKKSEINKEYAEIMEEILSYNDITTEGNLDEEELERLFKVKGITVINKLDNQDFLDELNEADEKSIFAEHLKNPDVHGLILNVEQDTSINRNLIREVYGVAKLTHDTTWENESNIIISTGTTFNKKILIELKKNYQELKLKKEQIEKDSLEKNEDIEVDFSDLKSLSQKSKTSQTTRPSTRERRSVGVKNETRYRR